VAEEEDLQPIEDNTTREHSLDELAKGLANGSFTRGRALKLMGAVLLGGVLSAIPGVAFAHHRSDHTGGGGQPTNPGGRRGCPERQVTVDEECVTDNLCPGAPFTTTCPRARLAAQVLPEPNPIFAALRERVASVLVHNFLPVVPAAIPAYWPVCE
jgi:hypothetical protein